MPQRDPELWINISTYAKAYGVDRKTVYKWLAAGLLEHWRVDCVVRIKHQPPAERRETPRADVSVTLQPYTTQAPKE